MPPTSDADTIRILVATDNHVGYNERDPIRGDDSWRSFHEIMCLAKDRDVDMVVLAGDLFHENKPSRKSMYQVMRSLRMNCLGEKPCELEMLSDASENFQGPFNYVNYEDPDINIAIPVFSIHGNHDDPSGEGHLAALDLLQICGLLNYYGRTPESDNILIKPVLLQKGRTKLALYGMSNVRDERLFRTFRDGKVKFFQPNTQKDDWFNFMCVHQNHHAYTETGYLPENFLPDFLDLVIWGHEHECLIEPRFNPEMGFHVMQPGSSVATSLMPGEAVPKHVALISITGKKFTSESIRLKTVRPFVMKEMVLADEKALKNVWRHDNNRVTITRHLMEIVEGMIETAKAEWEEAQEDSTEDPIAEPPLPLIRLRVEYSAPDGGRFDCENPQRFSNRFVGKVANVNDVIQFYRKKAGATRKGKDSTELPEESVLAQLNIDNVKVEKLVREFLTAQSLTILPQNSFGDAVSQFVDKDDKHAMEMFVNESLADQVKHLLQTNEIDEEDLVGIIDERRAKMEELFAAGQLRRTRKAKLKPRPDNWDSDLDGLWEDQPGALIHTDMEEENEQNEEQVLPSRVSGASAGRGRGNTEAKRKENTAAAAKKAPTSRGGRGKQKVVEEEFEDEQEDVIMIDDNDDDDEEEEEEEEELFVRPTRPARRTVTKKPPPKSTSTRTKSPSKRAPARSTTTRQTTLSFSQPASQKAQTTSRSRRAPEPSDDEISDDGDAFDPPQTSARSARSRK